MCTTPITTCALCVYNLWFMQTQIHCTLFLDCCAFSWNVCVWMSVCRFVWHRVGIQLSDGTQKSHHTDKMPATKPRIPTAPIDYHYYSLSEMQRDTATTMETLIRLFFFLLVVNLPLPIEDTVWHWRCHHCQKKKVAGDFYWLIGINYLTKWEWWYFGWIMWVSRATFVSLLSWMSAETDTALLNQSNCVAVSESEGERKREASVPFTLKKPLIIIE